MPDQYLVQETQQVLLIIISIVIDTPLWLILCTLPLCELKIAPRILSRWLRAELCYSEELVGDQG